MDVPGLPSDRLSRFPPSCCTSFVFTYFCFSVAPQNPPTYDSSDNGNKTTGSGYLETKCNTPVTGYFQSINRQVEVHLHNMRIHHGSGNSSSGHGDLSSESGSLSTGMTIRQKKGPTYQQKVATRLRKWCPSTGTAKLSTESGNPSAGRGNPSAGRGNSSTGSGNASAEVAAHLQDLQLVCKKWQPICRKWQPVNTGSGNSINRKGQSIFKEEEAHVREVSPRLHSGC